MAKKQSTTKKYYDESILKSGSKKTKISGWTDQQVYNQKEMSKSEYNKKPKKGE